MSKRTKKIVAIVLLLAFIAWLVFTVMPSGGDATIARDNIYEPKFHKEGELAFVSPESGDTIKQIAIEIADNEEEIQYGMMYRKSMDINTGMLFMMGEENMQSFWMRNTYVPLDIIFINDQNEVVSIQKNAKPLSEQSLPSEGPASKVLEVKGGFSERFGVKKGDKILYKAY